MGLKMPGSIRLKSASSIVPESSPRLSIRTLYRLEIRRDLVVEAHEQRRRALCLRPWARRSRGRALPSTLRARRALARRGGV
jgi:hypothetical protein